LTDIYVRLTFAQVKRNASNIDKTRRREDIRTNGAKTICEKRAGATDVLIINGIGRHVMAFVTRGVDAVVAASERTTRSAS